MADDDAIIPIEQDRRGMGSMMREMIQEYHATVQFYQTRMEKTAAEAHDEASAPADDFLLERTCIREREMSPV